MIPRIQCGVKLGGSAEQDQSRKGKWGCKSWANELCAATVAAVAWRQGWSALVQGPFKGNLSRAYPALSARSETSNTPSPDLNMNLNFSGVWQANFEKSKLLGPT